MTKNSASKIDLNDAGFATIFFSTDSGKYSLRECNDQAASLLQIANDQWINKSIDQLLPESTCANIDDIYKNVLTHSKSQPFTLSLNQDSASTLGGTAFKSSSDSIALIFESSQESNRADITAEWAKTADIIGDVITILDPEMRIIKANKATYDKFNLTEEQVVGKLCHKILHNLDSPCQGCPVPDTLEDKQVHHGIKLTDSTGKTVSITSSPLFDEKGDILMLIQISRDITNTVANIQKNQQLSKAIEQATDTVIITDPEGTILYSNPAFTKASGYPSAEALGQSISILESGKQEPEFYKDVWATIQAGKVWSGTFINKRKDGTFYSVQSTISPIFDDEKNISAYVAVERDITKEQSLEKKLQQHMKLEAIGTLAGGIAHDFNNILSAMIGYAEVVKAHVEDEPSALYAVDHILSSGDRAAELVKQIMMFSRQEDTGNEPLKPLRIQYVLKGVLKLIRSSLPATINLDQQIDIDCSPVLADASQVHQVIMNLCTNARQAIENEHGEITVSLAQKEITSATIPSNIPDMAPGQYACLKISDNGCGMDSDTVKRIFDPFFTTKSKEQNSGLGLSVVHGIINGYNGKMAVTSHPGMGTIFSIYFPIIENKEKPKETPTQIVGGTEKILLVDDEPQITEFLTVVLKRLGYSITAFTDSLRAVQFFRENSEEVDIVITDMTMPNMTGAELAKEILSIRPELPIILATGYSENFDREKALRLGIREFLAKPLKREKLAHTIRMALDNG